MTLALKSVFIFANWKYLKQEGFDAIVKALLSGLRFDIAALMYLLLPAFIIFSLMILKRLKIMQWIMTGYCIILTVFIQIFWLADIQYFEEAGKHFTYEAFAYLNLSLLPVLSGAFQLHPFLSTLSILSGILFSVLTYQVIQWCLKKFISSGRIRTVPYTFTLIVSLSFAIIGTRGGVQHLPVNIGDSVISQSPYLNAVCLNPIFSAFRTAFSSQKQLQFFDEEFNIRNVRSLLDIKEEQSFSSRYPLLRYSSGTINGNRKNIVLFLLESWTARDIGCLGSEMRQTPFFDELAQHGMLFTNFYATGIRTAEGVLSVLCSFPNQPLMPIMKRQEVYQTQWRSISRILAEAGYYNIFVHGRDLDFDNLHQFLKFTGFHRIIDRNDFPPSVSSISDSWPGYHDEDVMRRADAEFSKQIGHPFFGIIYTMNTHPPFVTPEDFPKSFPPTTTANKFLNSLRYSDHSLETFFRIAREKPYFKDTIFIFVADHTRTRDNFNFSNQHHIPMLIYAPGYIQPAINQVVGSQLDILPTVLGLLQLKTTHSSWGRNLLELPNNKGFAVCIAGNEVRWHDSHYLFNDNMTDSHLLLFDTIKDPDCTTDIWGENQQTGEILKTRTRSFISLSQTLLYKNRIAP